MEEKKEYFINGMKVIEYKDDPPNTITKEQALRFNHGKLPFDEILPQFEEEIAKVMLYGQKKYGRFNWMKGAPISQFYGCIRRHLAAIYKGEDVDAESGCLHLGHIATNLMMLHYNMLHKPENDDRPFKD